jgi:hypothetical protein
MYTIYYIFNNRYNIMHCRNRKVLQICYNSLKEEGANIICVKDLCNHIVTMN